MPRFAHLWRHCVINTRNTWLHGDPRGFRSRNRDIESSGDYKNPPPPDEYRKLNEYFEEVAGDEVHIERDLRPIIGRAIVAYLREHGYRVLAVSVGKVHGHAVVELPQDRGTVTKIFGEVKRKSSRAVNMWLPGSVWGAGGEFKVCFDRSHLKNAVDYVLYKQGPEAWTWSYKDRNDEGVFARKRPKKRK